MRTTLERWWGLVARLVVGGVWIAAGQAKLPDPSGSVRAVRAYDLLPEGIVPTVATPCRSSSSWWAPASCWACSPVR